MENQNGKDKQSFLSYLKIHLVNLILMCKENKKNILIIGAFVVVIAVVLTLGIMYEKQGSEQAVAPVEGSTTDEVLSTQEVVLEEALEENAYPEVVNLVKQYYQAMVEGDMATIGGIASSTGDKETIIIETKSEYIETYPEITVYTKSGPEEGSLIAYVYYQVKFLNYESRVPGVSPLYICMKEDGTYYINQSVTQATKDYIDQVTAHNDVIDLYNKVQVEYNEVLAGDEELNNFLAELKETLKESVGLELARLEEENAPEPAQEEEQEPELITVVTKVRTTDVVNVRSSDSIEADRIGQTTSGQVLDLIEELLNGWSKVEFEGKEGFIKSEFLEPEETTVVQNENVADTEENADSDSTGDAASAEEEEETTEGKLTDTVNVRRGPGTDEDKLGQLSRGTTIEIIEKMNNGWTKIKYEDGEAYVKSDYVE